MSHRLLIKKSRAKNPEDALVFLEEHIEIGSGKNKSSSESIKFTRCVRREINIIKKILAKKKIKPPGFAKNQSVRWHQKHHKHHQSVADRKKKEAAKVHSHAKKNRGNRPRLKQKPYDLWKQCQRNSRAGKPKKLNMVQRIVGPPKKSQNKECRT